MNYFYCPTKFEIPSPCRNHFKSFGVGKEAAINLGKKLNILKPLGPIVVLGCSGALNPKIKVGDCFLIARLKANASMLELNIPSKLSFLPTASLCSLEKPVSLPADKAHLHSETQVDLVDCEMFYLWTELSEELRDRVIFIRGVSDAATDSLDFLNGFHVKPKNLLNPLKLYRFIRFIRNFMIYRSKMDQFFSRIVNILGLDEMTQA